MGIVDRSLRLAALASAAVPGLDPISVQEIVLGADEDFDVAFIQDSQQRRWVIRAPRTEVAAARMDASLAMLALLVRRVPFAVPSAKGFAPIPGIGRAAVHGFIPGHPLDLAALHARHPLTADLGRTIGMIHNVDRELYDEAGLPSYDAESYRKRRLAEIDRGAATGRVPAGLLARWEEALDDVRLWRFAPTPVHGSLDGAAMLVTFPDPSDTDRATIRGVTGWESAQVADPADDFAALVGQLRPDAVDAVLEAYRQVRVERPDDHLLSRARLASELQLLGQLLTAVSGRDEVATEALTARLRRLDDAVHDERQSRRLRIVPVGPVPVKAADSGELSGLARPSAVPVPPGSSARQPEALLTPDPEDSNDHPAVEVGYDESSTAAGADDDALAPPRAIDGDATDVIDAVGTVDVATPPDEEEAAEPAAHFDPGQSAPEDDGAEDDGEGGPGAPADPSRD